jgi:tetratricopeptide (TPR) repeat protein
MTTRTLLSASVAWLAAAALVLIPGTASAQAGEEAPADGEEAIEEAPPEPPKRDRRLRRALKNFKKKEWALASLSLYKVLADEEQTYYRAEVSYHLAVCLERMKLPYSALAEYSRFFSLVEDDHELLAKGVERAVRLAGRKNGGWMIAPGLSALNTSRVAPAYRSSAMFWVGEFHYRNADYAAAVAYLSLVPKGTSHYARARMMEGIVKVAQGKGALAIAPLAAAVNAANPDDPDDNAWELANINIARTYYALGNFERAIEHFERIPRGSAQWFESLYEAAWSYFRLGRLSGALSHLQTVDSPFYADVYHPDATLLRILLFYYVCKYIDGQDMLVQFTELHRPMADELDSAIAEARKNPTRLFKALYAWHTERKESGIAVPIPVKQFFENDANLLRVGDYIRGIDAELAHIDRLKTGWEKSALRRDLEDALKRGRKKATDDKGTEILSRLETMVSTLRGHLGNAELYKVEMLTAQQGLYDAAYQGRLLDKIAARRLDPIVPEGYRFWPFEGEYWVDELGWYEVVAINECLEIQR